MTGSLVKPTAGPVAPASSVRYRPAIDGLRAVAVLAVFIFHLNRRWLPGGFVGVDVFFVISGFLISSILLREYEHKSFSLWKFYQRRIARLFPAFFAVALVTLLVASFLYSGQDLASCGATLASAALSVVNLKYMMQGSYFAISPDAQPFLHYWSLSVEEQFYLLFPAMLLLLYLKTNRYTTAILGVLCGISLVACIVLTYQKPTWAFYLLPTRAWELMAGSILANLCTRRPIPDDHSFLRDALSPVAGLTLIVGSLFLLNEGPAFPGYQAVLPVLGAVCFLGIRGGGQSWTERLLSTGPMVFVGQMSYSLYLWHWPVFSFVDYKLYFASVAVRLFLKIALSAAAATLCFFFIERPGRMFFNHPGSRKLAFGFLVCALAICVPLGTAVRRANYVDAAMDSVRQGGLAFSLPKAAGSIVLMGDSNGSMYGKMTREIGDTLRLKVNVISVAGGDPLPRSSGQSPKLWLDSLAFVTRDHPDVLVLACNWVGRLSQEKDRLEIAVNELKQHARFMILLTQPPELPRSGSREAIREGSRPPFTEDPSERSERTGLNAFLKRFRGPNVAVIDIESLFSRNDGGIEFIDKNGRLLYQDDDHLSGAGADQVKPYVMATIREMLPRLAEVDCPAKREDWQLLSHCRDAGMRARARVSTGTTLRNPLESTFF